MKANTSSIYKSIIIVCITSLLIFISDQWMQHQLQAAEFKPSIELVEFNSNGTKNSDRLSTTSISTRSVKRAFASTQAYQTTKAFEAYRPKYYRAAIDPSNYGDRYSTDVHGRTLNNQPIAVLHETVGSATSAINTFRRHNTNDNHQSSYHALITLDGTIVYLVPSNKRAFGAGNSAFKSSQGLETVQTNPNLAASVNNFAYHISLETPLDGRNKSGNSYHSGYTDSQYKSLAWLLALSSIPDDRITTHQAVDLSGNRFDPRSFDFDKFFAILHTYRQPNSNKVSI